MKKILALLLLVCMVLPMTAYAGQKVEVHGDFTYTPLGCEKEWWANDNQFLRGCSDEGTWYQDPETWKPGDFLGTSDEVYSVTLLSVTDPFEYEYGLYKGRVTFKGEVAGKEGTLEMLFVGKSPGNIAEWSGTWRIISGTGDLADLHGNGEFWSNGMLDVHCEGRVHFAP